MSKTIRDVSDQENVGVQQHPRGGLVTGETGEMGVEKIPKGVGRELDFLVMAYYTYS